MSKPWEVKMSAEQLGEFIFVLGGLKRDGVSGSCPFNHQICVRSKPNCGNFVKGLKRNDKSTETACPCYKFRTKSLIWRIEKLLSYNKHLIK